MATKYAKLSKKAVCGKNGHKNMQQAKMQNYAKGSLWEKMSTKYAKLNRKQFMAKLS